MPRTAPAPRRGRLSRAVDDWRPSRLRRNAALLLAGLPLQAAGPALLIASFASFTLPLTALLGGKPVVMLSLALAVAVEVAAAGPLTSLHRRRFLRLAGQEIPPAAAGADALTWAELAASIRSGASVGAAARRLLRACRRSATWRQLGYHLLAGPALGLLALLALGAGPAALALAAAGATRFALPHGGQKGLAAILIAAALLIAAAPWLLGSAARLDGWAASRLLGPGRTLLLAHRVEALTQSRAGMVDAADAERRRIERDLHDGAQQRLVSLALNLGMARADLTGLPDQARKVIADAHEEAKAALAELRDLVRGLHPAILEDRGLDAALSGVAARAPFPVRLRVRVPRRPAPTVEAIAYFVVSEALANITKHAQASLAEVDVDRLGDLLRVRVADNGVGGADPARGTGLAGLARRAGSVDGTFALSSPPGGPTQITVELPCAP